MNSTRLSPVLRPIAPARGRGWWRAALVALSLPLATPGAGKEIRALVDFNRDVKPILARRCLACHNEDKHKGGLRLDRREEAMRGGKSGKPVIIPGHEDRSSLVQRLLTRDDEERMPPKGAPLATEQIAVLKRWIKQGAVWPAEDPNKKHWSFIPPVLPAVPAVKNKQWPRNPIDNFIAAKLDGNGWRPAPPATPPALLRRLYLDLTGLPPTLNEQERFLKDPSPAAFDALTEELLARPSYGERWGRHWLDLVRYAESNGYERDAAKPFVWRYRDYVIDAFNHDKPYDRFIREQLAGDELPDASAETMIATGFHRLGPWDDEPADPLQDRADQLDDIIRTTAQVFLGVTLGCARCHDHKFDPLTAKDYYSMAAIMSPLQRPQNGRSDVDVPAGSYAQIAALAERDRQLESLNQQIETARAGFRAEFLKTGKCVLPPEAVQAFVTEAKNQTSVQKELAAKHGKQLEEQLAAALPAETRQKIATMEQTIAQLRNATPDLPRGYFPLEPPGNPAPTHLLLRGRAANPGPEMAPAVPVALTPSQPPFLPRGTYTSQRRLSLAQWIASPQNPLTARVIVNRVWQHHFGEGLATTPSDFGLMGAAPTHPELLDWLALWVTHEGGWSLKKLHRLILSSNTYRMSNRWNDEYGRVDPEHKLRWRFPSRRLEVEAIRDSILAVSGQLNPKMSGPSMFPYIPKEAMEGHSDPGSVWQPSDEHEASRRTVYAFMKRSLVVPMLEVLDLCDSTQSADKRSITSIAPQALTLYNGGFVNEQAAHFATRLVKEAGVDPVKQIERAYRLAVCRAPTASEISNLRSFMEREAKNLLSESLHSGKPLSPETATRSALIQLCRVILNLNEFAYTD